MVVGSSPPPLPRFSYYYAPAAESAPPAPGPQNLNYFPIRMAR